MSRWIVTVRQYGKDSDIFLQELSLEVTASNPDEAKQVALSNLAGQLQESVVSPVTTKFPTGDIPAGFLGIGTLGARNRITKVQRIRGS